MALMRVVNFCVSVKLSEYLLADHFPFGCPLIPPYAYPNGSSVSIFYLTRFYSTGTLE